MPESNKERLLLEAYLRSARRLDTQQAIALASDQRGLVAAGVSIAGATLIGASEAATIYKNIATACMVISAVLSLASVMPQPMYTSGSHASDLSTAIDKNANFKLIIKELCDLNDTWIEKNEELAKQRSNKFKCSLGAFTLGSIVFLLHALS